MPPQGVHIPNFYCPQKRWRVSPNNKSENTEQVHSRRPFQDRRLMQVSEGVDQLSESDPGPLWGIGPDNQQSR